MSTEAMLKDEVRDLGIESSGLQLQLRRNPSQLEEYPKGPARIPIWNWGRKQHMVWFLGAIIA